MFFFTIIFHLGALFLLSREAGLSHRFSILEYDGYLNALLGKSNLF